MKMLIVYLPGCSLGQYWRTLEAGGGRWEADMRLIWLITLHSSLSVRAGAGVEHIVLIYSRDYWALLFVFPPTKSAISYLEIRRDTKYWGWIYHSLLSSTNKETLTMKLSQDPWRWDNLERQIQQDQNVLKLWKIGFTMTGSSRSALATKITLHKMPKMWLLTTFVFMTCISFSVLKLLNICSYAMCAEMNLMNICKVWCRYE